MSATSRAAHFDEENYTNAAAFDPWRFSDMESADSPEMRNQLVNTHPEFLTFGLGKQAWCVSELHNPNTYRASNGIVYQPGALFRCYGTQKFACPFRK